MGKGGRDSGVSGVSGEVQPDADLIALFEERAAIREFEAGFDRPMAQSLAIDDCLNELTGWSTDEVVRADALRTLRGAGIRQPQTFPTASDDPPF